MQPSHCNASKIKEILIEAVSQLLLSEYEGVFI